MAEQIINRRNLKILFVHNTLMWYTRPFFARLGQIYDVKFIFTDMQIRENIYGSEASALEGFDEIKYKVIRRRFHPIFASGIPLGLIKVLFSERYDLVVATSGSIEALLSFLAARLRNKFVILWSEEWGWKGKYQERKLFRPFLNYVLSRADAVLVPGTKHREYFVAEGAPPGKVFLMPNASNIIIQKGDYDEKENLRKRFNIGTRKVILYVGRLIKRKGVEYLLRAFCALRQERDDIALMIVGEGELRNQLESLAESLNIKGDTYFVGYVKGELLPPYYLLCDVCVVPSTRDEMGDPWVFVMNEAMYSAKPVIATDAVGSAFDMIKDGVNGFIVPEKDDEALYKAIIKIISEPELARKMGEESKRIVEQGFIYEHMINGFVSAVNQV